MPVRTAPPRVHLEGLQRADLTIRLPDGQTRYRGNAVDQNFDSYSTEFTFADGTKLYMEGRTIPGCFQDHSSYAHGTKGSAIISKN